MRSPARIAAAVAIFAAAAALLPHAFAGTEPIEPPTPAVLPASDEEIEKLMEAYEGAKANKNADERDTDMARVVLSMIGHSHESFIPIIKEGMKSKNKHVLAASIRAAASHDITDVEKDVRKLLNKKMKKKRNDTEVPGQVHAACIEYLARLAIEGEEDAVIEQLERLFEDERRIKATWAVDMVRASVHYLGQVKVMAAVPQLVDMVREPYPENPNSASNPPASYWESRYKLWQEYEGWVRWALKEITDLEFRTHTEWRAWVKQNKKKFR